jgi:putative ABC transport system ATP-binding protein
VAGMSVVEQTAAVSLHDVERVYGRRGAVVRAVAGVTTEFAPGTFTAVMGPSGSGKSTLLQCAAGLDRPTSGTVRIAGQELGRMSETALTKLRRTRIGFVFQAFNLVSALSVRENVLLPMRLAGVHPDRRWVADVLDRVGLTDKARRRPAQLSGGQQQRVAIARALACRPDVIFADEPTGALDSTTAAEVLGLLRSAVDRDRQTVVMVTHDPVAASYADRVIFLADGRIVADGPAEDAAGIAAHLTRLAGGAAGRDVRPGGRAGTTAQAYATGRTGPDAVGRALGPPDGRGGRPSWPPVPPVPPWPPVPPDAAEGVPGSGRPVSAADAAELGVVRGERPW